jgi:hypothetical protein
MFSGYSLAWHVPRVLRDGRQRTISAKRPPSKTPQAPRQQPPAGRCGSSEGRTVASRRKPSEVRSGPRRICKMHGRQCKVQDFTVQPARLRRLRLAFLHTQPRSGGVGAFDPARHYPFLAQSKVRGRWLWTGRLRGFRRRLHGTRFIASPSWSTLGTPHAKGIAQTVTRTKRKNT